MTASELRRWLKSLGAKLKEGTNHTKVFLNGRFTVIPRHASKEIGTGLIEKIKRDLGLK
ncbi:MAG: type II toxin-antitoxin system HicA family toxin [Acidobacteria bacterium]|nr:type II toxin-antitoxin system HicA family toxin [Acidobacteriota bacterium]